MRRQIAVLRSCFLSILRKITLKKNNVAAYAYLYILVLESFTVGSPGELHVRTYRSTRTYYPYITKTNVYIIYIPTSHKNELNSYCRELYLVSCILVLWMLLFYTPHKIHLPYPSELFRIARPWSPGNCRDVFEGWPRYILLSKE